MKSLGQKLNKKQTIIVFCIVGACLIYADISLLLSPTIRNIKNGRPKLEEAKRKYTFAKNAVTNMPKFKNDIKQYQDKLLIHKKQFSTSQEVSSILLDLSTMARNAGVKIVGVKPHSVVTKTEKDASEEAYKRCPISIRAICGYHQLGVFLNKLENADTFMRVTDIKIAAAPAEEGTGQEVYLLINTYIINSEGVS